MLGLGGTLLLVVVGGDLFSFRPEDFLGTL